MVTVLLILPVAPDCCKDGIETLDISACEVCGLHHHVLQDWRASAVDHDCERRAMTMTMTRSEKSRIHRMKAWPYKQECRDHGPTKKNLFYW